MFIVYFKKPVQLNWLFKLNQTYNYLYLESTKTTTLYIKTGSPLYSYLNLESTKTGAVNLITACKLYSYLNLESTKDNFAHAKNQVNLDLVLGFIFEQMVVNYQLVGKEIGMLSLTFILPLATEAWSIS